MQQKNLVSIGQTTYVYIHVFFKWESNFRVLLLSGDQKMYIVNRTSRIYRLKQQGGAVNGFGLKVLYILHAYHLSLPILFVIFHSL